MTFVRNNQKERSVVSIIEWRIAIYLRLSKEDGDKPESDSIQNQRAIIENHIKYLESQGESILSVTVYSDDGYPGGNFNRPGYKRMIDDVEAGRINCVIFKDNSRLGRNYPELGKLMEEYFPQKKVRVISVLNHIDSYKDPYSYSSSVVSFSNIMNDDYIRQLSIKIKSTFAMKRARGEFLGNYAPYGYQKSPENPHKLVIDPEAAEVVRMIFNWYTQGLSAHGIVKELNALGIMPPSVYKTNKGCGGFAHHSSGQAKTGVWSMTSVSTMLQDEVYIGNMVQGKYKSVSYRSKRMVPVEESEWTVVEGTHEPIISFEQFALVHDRFARRTRVSPYKRTPYLLSGFVKCAHCGSRMNRNVSQGTAYYRCMTRVRSPEVCQCSYARERYLEAVILETLQNELRNLVDAEKIIAAAKESSAGARASTGYQVSIRKAEQEIERIKQEKFRLYDNLQSGMIDEVEYVDFRTRYDAEIEAQKKSIERLRASLKDLQAARKQDDEFVEFFRRYGNIQKLDRDLLNALLDHVEYTDRDHIDIFFKFSDVKDKLLDRANAILNAE